jgi:hypothetical protein
VAKKRIFTVGFTLPGDEFELIEFESNRTLLDSDIILIEPSFGSLSVEHDYARGAARLFSGVPILSEHSSFVAKKQTDHWRSEIAAAVNAGKLVIVYLSSPIERYRYNGEKNYHGSGKSRVASPVVVPISSYDAIPNLSSAIVKFGESIRLEKDGAYLAPYWNEFSQYSQYQVEIDGKFTRTLLKSLVGNRTVGAAFHGNSGALLFLPPLRYDEDAFMKEAEDDEDEDEPLWTKDALKFGKRLISALVALADNLKSVSQTTPSPEWSMRPEYRLGTEASLETAITQCMSEIASLQVRKAELEVSLEDAGELRRLLFEQGKPLEKAILEAMKLLGFAGQSFVNGDSEFDGIFVCAEGRCLGEAEGKDNKAINIEKFSQLERNLQEDFARDEVTEYAKGILFGNAFRLLPISDRTEFFTAKCLSASKRIGAAHVRTPDLFGPAKYLKENPSDAKYAQRCRDAIFSSAGEIVAFPSPPTESGDVEHLEAGDVEAAPANS